MTDDLSMESGMDIAVIGMSGRFPGARGVGELWTLLREGASGISTFTDDELRAEGMPEDLINDPAYVKAGSVLDGIAEFDAEFFGVLPAEARILDPQQRLFLEHAWEALEDAGCDPTRFPGPVGVFGGSAWSSYLAANLAPNAELYATMGELAIGLANEKDSLTTRVAHTFGLSGPSYAIQSYCSTSLVAVAAAATSLANAECDLALAGGVSVNVPHRVGYLYQPGGMTSPDGRCRAFDDAAEGTPVGSGVGVVALRRLEDAVAAGDRIYAVISGWAVNNDAGRKVGFTAPGVQGQADVVSEALAAAGLAPADIDYIEAHGTGTALGDAAELAALQQVFRGERCRLGSVKSNLGHLDRAAGVTGLIKVGLALHHEELPATLNYRAPNEQLLTGDAELTVVAERQPWARGERPRRAGVSAFGIGGTNAHVVLQEAPRPQPERRPRRHEVLVWSARGTAAADAYAERLADAVADGDLSDTAYTLQTGRRVFEHRRVVVAGDGVDAAAALREGRVLGRTETRGDRPVGWLIAGVGEQFPGMAAQLYATEPVFRDVVDECRAALREHLGRDPLTAFVEPATSAEGGDLARMLGRTEPASDNDNRTSTIQPAVFAVEYALGRLLLEWGVRPSVMLGYSVGEYVAAALADVLSVRDALALVAHRARLIDALPPGGMAAVGLSTEDVFARIAALGLADALDVAARNGPQLTVVSGELDALGTLRDALGREDLPCRPLDTTHAFHSRMLAPARAALTEWVAANVTLRPPSIPYVSTVTGALITDVAAADPGYWTGHMCAPVDFAGGLATVLADADLALLELGPGQSLGAMARQHPACDPARWPLIVPTLPGADRRPDDATVAEALGRLWLAGVPIDWDAYQSGRGARKTGVPTYAFQRRTHWVDRPTARTGSTGRPAAPKPALLAPAWRPAAAMPATHGGRWVLLADRGGLATRLAERLAAQGAEVLVDTTDDYLGLVRRATQDLGDRPLRIAVLRPLDGGTPAGHVLPLAGLTSALADADNVRIVVVTRGVDTAPDQAAVPPVCVVASQEHPGLACRVVDRDAAADVDADADVDALADELARDDSEPVIALRAGTRRRLDYVPVTDEAAIAVRAGGTYLVTGGLGDIGLLLAGHLAAAGATRLVLTSRRGLPATGDRAAAVARLRATGAEVLTPAVDVTDEVAMRALVAELGRVDGVVHAAGETDLATMRPLAELTGDLVDRHFAAKVDGARVLDAVLADLPEAPGFCVVFSSISAVLGGLGFAPYAAANAALTAFARSRRTRWLSAAWDTWAPTLAKLTGGIGATMAEHSMTEADGLAAFDRVLAAGAPAVLVAVGDLAARQAAWRLPAPTPSRVSGGAPRPDLAQPYVPPRTETERTLCGLWSDLLGIAEIGVNDNFFDLGGSSLLGLQFVASVKKRFGVAVTAVTLFEAPTVRAFAEVLAPAPAPAPVTPARARTEAGSDDQADRAIAIVGMAGRFPGAASVDELWRNLVAGKESIRFFTPGDLRAAGVSEEDLADPAYVPARPVLDDIRGFDAGLFGYSPRAATFTDPQQRIFLEVCWEALEHAGYGAPEHRGRVGVYGGTNISTYLLQAQDSLRLQEEMNDYELVMGNDKDALTTTVSYTFNLSGPSVAVQTFCSTSLVAVHLACQSLRAGEAELALAGGVSVRVPDRIGHVYQPGGMASPDGHVRTFDADARGSMFGDGAAVVVLKPLAAALRDGDTVWGVIRGSAMNNDGGLKVGYTAPSVVGQARVVADALADAGVSPADVGYVEAHGTGTELGDPIEVAALTRAFGPDACRRYCLLGSVKPNVGHLDRAAGVTGLIKVALAAKHGVIPPTLHFRTPNPEIDFANSPFRVAAELTPWPAPAGGRRIAGVNSLGMGGTNVHMVVEEPPAAPEPSNDARRYHVLPVSAASAEAADAAAARLAEALRAGDLLVSDVAYTLQTGRARFGHRRIAAGTSREALAAVFAGERGGPALLRRTDPMEGRRVAFVFAGVGEQYPGMVDELYRREPVFRSTLDDCAAVLAEHAPGVDLIGLVTGERAGGASLAELLGQVEQAPVDERTATLRRTDVAQPAVFAVEYALAATLVAWGIRPEIMLGYSLGEYVAACLAGVLSLPDALRLVAYRANLIAKQPPGAMLAVSLSAEEFRRRFGDTGLDVAVRNGPGTVVVAGEPDAVDALAARLADAEIASRALDTTHAFHSRMLEPLRAELTHWISANITLHPPVTPYLANLTGRPADAALVRDPGYWARHMCETVEFAEGVRALLADPELAIVEIGPGQSLGALIRSHDCPRERWPLITATLPGATDRRADDETLADCLARLWLAGVDIDWPAVHGPGRRPGRVPLPTYPFQRTEYWITDGPAAGRATPNRPAERTGTLFEQVSALPRLPEPEWLHLPVWRQKPGVRPVAAPGPWVVYTDGGAADAVLAALGEPDAVLVRPGERFATTDTGYTVRPGSLEDTVALLAALGARDKLPRRVVHLWTLTDDPAADPGPSAVDDLTVHRGLHTLAAFARAAGELGLGEWTLDVVTSASRQVLRTDDVHPARATVLGPCRVIPLEYPGVTTRLVDVAPDAIDAALVAAELRAPVTDQVVALRGGRRWVPGYEPMPAPEPVTPREHGVYLVTGGLGGIGLAMAERLARDCRARLVLLGRTGLPAEDTWDALLADPVPTRTRQRVQAVRRLRELGADVAVVAGDVASTADVRRAVDTALTRFGALHGVLHAAGVPAVGLMQFKQPAELDPVLAPKVTGTAALATALRLGEPDEVPLDFLALFSSITSATGGGPGQVDYCAANAYLDAFAARFRRPGRTVVAIGWGEWTWNAWAHGLDGYDPALREFFRANRARFGIGFDEGWRALCRVLALDEPGVVVSTQDFTTISELAGGFTVDLVRAPAVREDTGTRHPRPELATAFAAPRTPTEETIARVWADALKLDRVGIADSFFELGGNSLIGVDVVAKLRRELGLAALAPHVLYEAPTVEALAAVLGGAAESTSDRRLRAELRRSGLRDGAAQRRRNNR